MTNLESNLADFEAKCAEIASIARRTSVYNETNGYSSIYNSGLIGQDSNVYEMYIAYQEDPKDSNQSRWEFKAEIDGTQVISYFSEGLISMLSNIHTNRWDIGLVQEMTVAIGYLRTKIIGRRRKLTF